MKPEEEARKKIDELLEKAGWQKYDKAAFGGVQMELLSKTKTVRWFDKTLDDKEKTNDDRSLSSRHGEIWQNLSFA